MTGGELGPCCLYASREVMRTWGSWCCMKNISKALGPLKTGRTIMGLEVAFSVNLRYCGAGRTVANRFLDISEWNCVVGGRRRGKI